MKKYLGLAVGLAILSTSAFASKARLEALGQDKHGSFFIDDTRSAFLNPASLNGTKDYAIFEWGTDNAAAETTATPHAEGGYFQSHGNFTWGLYFGNEVGNESHAGIGTARASITDYDGTAYSALSEDNVLQLFIAGDAGLEWGVSLRYAKSADNGNSDSDNADKTREITHDSLDISLGVNTGDIGAFVHLGVKDEADGGGADKREKYEGDFAYRVGVTYGFGNATAYGEWDQGGFEYTPGLDASGMDPKPMWDEESRQGKLGVGWENKVSKSTTVYADVNYYSRFRDSNQYQNRSDSSKWGVPVTFAAEAMATSWLDLRGSVSMELMGESSEYVTAGNGNSYRVMTDTANTVNVAAGATLNFGKLKVDGLIGTDGDNRGNSTDKTEEGILATDNLMTRVAVHYWF